jgi:RimJ/RimL family protein N-acetyltransferase
MATLGGARSPEVNRDYLRRNIAHWEEHGYGIWVFLDASGQLIGRGGLLLYDLLATDEVELNYSVAADHWLQGYATEMATASLRLGFEHLPVTSIIAFTLATNHGSRKVMEKVGMTYERDFLHARLPHALYRIDKSAMTAGPLI